MAVFYLSVRILFGLVDAPDLPDLLLLF